MTAQDYFKLLKKYKDIEVLTEYKNKHIDYTFEIYETADSREAFVILEGNDKSPDWYDGVYIDEYEYAEKVMEIMEDLNDLDIILWYLDGEDVEEHIDWETLCENLEEEYKEE